MEKKQFVLRVPRCGYYAGAGMNLRRDWREAKVINEADVLAAVAELLKMMPVAHLNIVIEDVTEEISGEKLHGRNLQAPE